MKKSEIVAKIKDMLEDTEGAVQNEHIWALGAPDEEQASMHSENERNLEERVENLKLIIKVLENDEENKYFADAICEVLAQEELAETEYVDMFKELKEKFC